MHDERTVAQSEHAVDQAILAFLLERETQRPWSEHELELEIGSAVDVEDSLARLHGAGLAHRCGGFAWASRPALRAEELIG